MRHTLRTVAVSLDARGSSLRHFGPGESWREAIDIHAPTYDAERFFCFLVGPMRLALPLEAVVRVHGAAQTAPVADCAPLLKGLIDIAGEILPVISMRERLGLADRDILPEDRFVVVRSPLRTLVLLVDDVLGVFDSGEFPVTNPCDVLPDMSLVAGLAVTPDGLVQIHDLDALVRPVRDVLARADLLP